MILLNYPEPPIASEFIQIHPSRRYIIPVWYRDLRERAHRHIISGDTPNLSAAPEPLPLQLAPIIEAAANAQQSISLTEAAGYDTIEEEEEEEEENLEII